MRAEQAETQAGEGTRGTTRVPPALDRRFHGAAAAQTGPRRNAIQSLPTHMIHRLLHPGFHPTAESRSVAEPGHPTNSVLIPCSQRVARSRTDFGLRAPWPI
jgi:hypothetical protein